MFLSFVIFFFSFLPCSFSPSSSAFLSSSRLLLFFRFLILASSHETIESRCRHKLFPPWATHGHTACGQQPRAVKSSVPILLLVQPCPVTASHGLSLGMRCFVSCTLSPQTSFLHPHSAMVVYCPCYPCLVCSSDHIFCKLLEGLTAYHRLLHSGNGHELAGYHMLSPWKFPSCQGAHNQCCSHIEWKCTLSLRRIRQYSFGDLLFRC